MRHQRFEATVEEDTRDTVSGRIQIATGTNNEGNSGSVDIGTGDSVAGDAGDMTIKAGNSVSGKGGNLEIQSGSSSTSKGSGVLIKTGSGRHEIPAVLSVLSVLRVGLPVHPVKNILTTC